MAPKTITRAHLSDAIHLELGLSRQECGSLVDEVINLIASGIAENDRFTISNFGSFNVRSKRQRIGRNPKTGEPAIIAARKVVTFRPSDKLKKRIAVRGD